MYFNKKRWKEYLRHRPRRTFLICEDLYLLDWFYYFTHTEEEIRAAEEKEIQELRDLVEQYILRQDV